MESFIGDTFNQTLVSLEHFQQHLYSLNITLLMSDFTQHVTQIVSDPKGFWNTFMSLEALSQCILLMAFFATLCFVLSVATGNYSWVDRSWSLVPVIYSWWIPLRHAEPLTSRETVMMTLTFLWGARLTFNFYRKGGYTWSGEDYRWAIVKQFVYRYAPLPGLCWQTFNLFFIALYQHILLLSLCFPMFIISFDRHVEWNRVDSVAAALMTFMIVFETLADEQQWQFHQLKAKFGMNPDDARVHKCPRSIQQDLRRGFLSHGLFQVSRHPNFFGEMGVWWSFYLFSVSTSGKWVNNSVVGPLMLTLLFQGSTWLTEKISSGKYPEYRLYQQCTSRIIPLPFYKDIEKMHEKEE
jgi:steroid 5-alpha reductase family enzyme